MAQFIMRAAQKYTGYQICIMKVEADSPEEAKAIVLEGGGVEIDTWDTATDDYEFIESDDWDITKEE